MTGLELSQVRALAISSDSGLAVDPRLAAGDTLTRQLAYARYVARYDVVVRAPAQAAPVRWRPSEQLRIRSVPASRWGFIVRGYQAALATALRAGSQVVTCQDPFSTGLVGYLLKRRLGIGLNLQINGDVIDNPYFLGEHWLYPAFNRLARWLIPRADTLRVSTTAERRKLIEQWGLAPERIWNVPFLVDFRRFLAAQPGTTRQWLGVPSDAPLVLFLGRLAKAKDLGVLLRAVPGVLARHPQAVFVLAGAGPEEPKLRRLAQELGIEASLRFPGRVPNADVPSLYAAADLFVLSSHYEGTSMVTLEAAASALPIVSTDVTGALDAVIDGETGFLVPKRDSRALAEALARLLADPIRAREMGRRGREHVLARFDPERIARQMAELWYATARLAQ